MLPDSKISQLISLQIPGLTYVMWQYRVSGPLYEVIHVFADYTKRMIRGGQLLDTVDAALGNRPVKTLLPAVLQQARTQQLHNGTN